MSKTTKKEIPNYGQWTTNDLLNETTRLALAIDRAEQQDNGSVALLYREQYHTAMVALIDKAEPFDPEARERATRTRRRHVQLAQVALCERLGLAGAVPA